MKYTLITCISFLLFSCETINKQNIEYVDLNSFKDDSTLIKEGTALEILAFSGCKPNDKDAIYYEQIIVRNKETGDTVSILCPSLKSPVPNAAGRTYIPTMEYNPSKRILNASFERKKDNLNMLLQLEGDEVASEEKGVDVTRYMNDKIVKKQLVAVNKSLPFFKTNYKTVIGILAFETDPR